MVLCKVTGNIVATHKVDAYMSRKLLIVRPVNLDGELYGDEIVAVDGMDVGAGIGDVVLLITEGGSARIIARKDGLLPIENAVAGIVDTVITSHGDIHQCY